MSHTPVLLHEVIEMLDPKPGEFCIDGTLGAGGHATEIIKRLSPGGTFLGVDRDQYAVAAFHVRSVSGVSGVRQVAVRGSYAQLPEILARQGLGKADGLLLDLGFSSDQVEARNRGFSFWRDEPLLMTYDESATPVSELLLKLSESQLAQVLTELGEERYAAKIAGSIWQMANSQGIRTTGQLVQAIKAVVPANYEQGRIHPATRTFMALRIYANDELGQLQKLLSQLPQILKPEARVVIISFHSLEDRIVKKFFQEHQYKTAKRSWVRATGERPKSEIGVKVGCLTILTKKPLTASAAEVAVNPRARSAKLRAAIITL